jgi:hypothetical protein
MNRIINLDGFVSLVSQMSLCTRVLNFLDSVFLFRASISTNDSRDSRGRLSDCNRNGFFVSCGDFKLTKTHQDSPRLTRWNGSVMAMRKSAIQAIGCRLYGYVERGGLSRGRRISAISGQYVRSGMALVMRCHRGGSVWVCSRLRRMPDRHALSMRRVLPEPFYIRAADSRELASFCADYRGLSC